MAVKPDSKPLVMPPGSEETRHVEVILVSGITAWLVPSGKLKGRDLIKAQRAIPSHDSSSPMAMAYAMLAPRVKINGRALVYEDLLEMDLEDINALMAADGNFKTPAATDESPAPPASSDSSGSASD
jgi:hypothetical protein